MSEAGERSDKRPDEDEGVPTASFSRSVKARGRQLLGPKNDMFSV